MVLCSVAVLLLPHCCMHVNSSCSFLSASMILMNLDMILETSLPACVCMLCMYICMYVCMHVCVFDLDELGHDVCDACVFVYVCLYVSVCVCV